MSTTITDLPSQDYPGSVAAHARKLEDGILAQMAVLYADEPRRVLQGFRAELAEHGTALAVSLFLKDPGYFGSLQEDTGGRLRSARRLGTDLPVYAACLARMDAMNWTPDGTGPAPAVMRPASIEAYTADLEVQRFHRRRLDSLCDKLFVDPAAARKLLSSERWSARDRVNPGQPVLGLDWNTVLQSRSQELGTTQGARPEDLAELAGLLRAVSSRSQHAGALSTRLEHAADVRDQRIHLGQRLSSALHAVFGDDGARAAEASFISDLGENGIFSATGNLRAQAVAVQNPPRNMQVLVDQLAATAIMYAGTLQEETFKTGMASEMASVAGDQEQKAARSEALAARQSQNSLAASIFKDPAAALQEINRLAAEDPGSLSQAVSDRVRAGGWRNPLKLVSGDPASPPAGYGTFVLASLALARTNQALSWMDDVARMQGLRTSPAVPSQPLTAVASPPPVVATSQPPATDEMDRFRIALSQDTYSVNWLPQRVRDKVEHVQIGLRNATITLDSGAKLVDAGPMGMSLQGRVDDESVRDLLESVATKGWSSVKLSGSDAFRDKAFVAFGLMHPPVQVVNHNPSPGAHATLASLIARRGLDGEEPSVQPVAGPVMGPH